MHDLQRFVATSSLFKGDCHIAKDNCPVPRSAIFPATRIALSLLPKRARADATAARTGRPLLTSSEAFSGRVHSLPFRCLIAPLGSGGDHVEFFFGAFSRGPAETDEDKKQ